MFDSKTRLQIACSLTRDELRDLIRKALIECADGKPELTRIIYLVTGTEIEEQTPPLVKRRRFQIIPLLIDGATEENVSILWEALFRYVIDQKNGWWVVLRTPKSKAAEVS